MDDPIVGQVEDVGKGLEQGKDRPAEDSALHASQDALEATEVVPRPVGASQVGDVPVSDASGQGGQSQASEPQGGELLERQERLKRLNKAERSIDSAFSTGRADRAKITRSAQLDAAEAVAMVGIAMEADEEADEAMRIVVIAQKSGNPEHLRRARRREREARKKAFADHREATRSARQAYDAIRFSAPNRMGFMRFVMVTLALHIIGVLVSLILTSRDTVVYNSVNIFTWVMVVLEGIAFWLFANRLKVARPFIIGVSVLALVADIIFEAAAHTLGSFTLTLDFVYYISLILYFSFSKRVKAVLVNDFAAVLDIEDDFKINRAGWPFFRNLVVYFIVFSVLGHWMEAAMCQLIRLGLVAGEYDPSNTMLWRDWFYPFPMEGAAVVIIALALYPLYEWLRSTFRARGRVWVAYVLSFIANALTCSLIEFTMGIIINADHSLWDYSDMFGNIMGQVCLQNALAFGAAASVITWFVYPQLERSIARIPFDVMNIISVAIFGIGGILWSLYLIDPPDSHSIVAEGEQLAIMERERDAISLDIESMRMVAQTLERDVRSSKTFEVENVQAEIDRLYRIIDVIERDLGIESDGDADATEATDGRGKDSPDIAAAGVESGAQGVAEGEPVSELPAQEGVPPTAAPEQAGQQPGDSTAVADVVEGQPSAEAAPAPEQAAPAPVPEPVAPDGVPGPPAAVTETSVAETPQEQQYHIAA